MRARLPEPSSPIAPHIVAFVCHKRALNRRYDVEDKVLRMLDGYLNARGVTSMTQITPVLLDAFFPEPSASPVREASTILSVSSAACSSGWSNMTSSIALRSR